VYSTVVIADPSTTSPLLVAIVNGNLNPVPVEVVNMLTSPPLLVPVSVFGTPKTTVTNLNETIVTVNINTNDTLNVNVVSFLGQLLQPIAVTLIEAESMFKRLISKFLPISVSAQFSPIPYTTQSICGRTLGSAVSLKIITLPLAPYCQISFSLNHNTVEASVSTLSSSTCYISGSPLVGEESYTLAVTF